MTKKFKFFWHSTSPGSNWYPSDFTLDGISFCSAEQAMMYHKAKVFGDTVIAEKILEEDTQRTIKALGRKVSNFNEGIWTHVSYPIVLRILLAKFTQDNYCFNWITDPEHEYFVEASPYDKIWGIGLEESNPLVLDMATWQGENRLGNCLNEVKALILKIKED